MFHSIVDRELVTLAGEQVTGILPCIWAQGVDGMYV